MGKVIQPLFWPRLLSNLSGLLVPKESGDVSLDFRQPGHVALSSWKEGRRGGKDIDRIVRGVMKRNWKGMEGMNFRGIRKGLWFLEIESPAPHLGNVRLSLFSFFFPSFDHTYPHHWKKKKSYIEVVLWIAFAYFLVGGCLFFPEDSRRRDEVRIEKLDYCFRFNLIRLHFRQSDLCVYSYLELWIICDT